MYIVKNALKNIRRAKVRNVLIGVIVLVIATSACVALSIRESAVKAKEEALENLQITAQISVDRQSLMSGAMQEGGGFDRDSMASVLQGSSDLSLEELQTYATAESVQSFYYTLSASLNAGEDIEPVDTAGTFERSEGSDTTAADSDAATAGGIAPQMPDNMGGGDKSSFKGGMMGSQGDFTLIGYSADTAMTDFVSGVCTITDGVMFDEGTADTVCVISDELATYNELAVGDTIALVNPNDETETVSLTVVGIYHNSQSAVSSSAMGGFSTATDAANQIYTSYTAVQAMVEASAAAATTTTDEDTGTTTSTAIRGQLAGTYTFASNDDYEAFDAQARALGLSDSYTISSGDLTSFEQSMEPLETLSTMATWFLLVVFAIGAVILVVLNIFNIRERKYEIGVLTAIGMKKGKVALQFITEVFVVTFIAILLGAGIGAVSSVPVTNALLENQISSTQSSTTSEHFGRDMGGMSKPGSTDSGTSGDSTAPSLPDDAQSGLFGQMVGGAGNYISEVAYATDLTVIGELILIGLLLTLIASLAAVASIMRYEPLKILSNRE